MPNNKASSQTPLKPGATEIPPPASETTQDPSENEYWHDVPASGLSFVIGGVSGFPKPKKSLRS